MWKKSAVVLGKKQVGAFVVSFLLVEIKVAVVNVDLFITMYLTGEVALALFDQFKGTSKFFFFFLVYNLKL